MNARSKLLSVTLSTVLAIALTGLWACLSPRDAGAQTHTGVYCDVVPGATGCYSCFGNPSPGNTGCQFPNPPVGFSVGACMQGARWQSCTPGSLNCGAKFNCGPPIKASGNNCANNISYCK